MWRSLIKYYKLIILSVAGCTLVVFVLISYNQSRDLNKLFELLETIDYSSVESAVVEKLNNLSEEAKKNPDSAESWGKLGMNLYIHGYKTESVPVLKMAAALDDKEFRWSYFTAIALDDLNSEETSEWFERSRPLKPHFPPLCIKLGDRYFIEGNLQKSEELFASAISSWKNVPHAYTGMAKIAIAKSELDTARAKLITALTYAPDFREAHILLADVYRRKREKANAEAEFKKIEKLPKKLDLKDPFFNQMVDEGVSSFWCQVRGDTYLNSGRLDMAVLEFKKVIAARPHPSFYNNLGNVYQKQKKYELAIEQYQLALKMDSVNIDALNNLGVVYFKTGDINKAISFVRHSLEINPDSKDGYLNMGTFYKQLNRRSESIQNFKHGMELAPDDLRFAYQLSWLLSSAPERHLRDGKEALRLAELVCDETIYDTPAKLDLLAAAHAENGQFREAGDIALKAYQLAIKTGKRQLATDIYKRFKLYKMNRPFRETNN